jgi:hypothetical protein
VLHGGGEGVTEELPAAIEEESLAGIESTTRGSLVGGPLELGGQLQGHLGNPNLQLRFGRKRGFWHGSASLAFGQLRSLLIDPPSDAKIR